MNRPLLAPWIAAACGLFALTSAAQAETLPELLEKLAAQHPRILAEEANLGAARSKETEAFSGYLPKVDLNGSIGKEDTDRTELLVAAGKFNLEPTIGTVSLTQNLFEGFRTQGALDAAQSGESAAEANCAATRQQVFFEAVSAYLAVLRQKELTSLSRRNMETLQQQLHLEDEKVQRGSGVAVDVLQAKSRLQISKERYTAFMGGLRDASANYTQLFGKPPIIEEMELPSIPLEQIPASQEDALHIALKQNPLLLGSRYNAEQAMHRQTEAKAGYYPTVDVVASSNYREDAGGIQGTEISNAVILRGSWQIFSGFADRARSRQAAQTHQAALARAGDAKRRVEEQVALAWSNLTISKERADLLDNAVNIAGEVYDARKRLRDAGSDTALNVLDAENELFRAQIDATAARYDYYASLYRLLLAMGLLEVKNI